MGSVNLIVVIIGANNVSWLWLNVVEFFAQCSSNSGFGFWRNGISLLSGEARSDCSPNLDIHRQRVASDDHAHHHYLMRGSDLTEDSVPIMLASWINLLLLIKVRHSNRASSRGFLTPVPTHFSGFVVGGKYWWKDWKKALNCSWYDLINWLLTKCRFDISFSHASQIT